MTTEKTFQHVYVIYHKNCMDGFGAAYAIWKHIGDRAAYIPCSYGDPVPEEIEEGSEVYIVDFSFSREELLKLKKRVAYMQVLDHHIQKKKEIGDLPFVTFDEHLSGAVMAWQLFSLEPVPAILKYIQDWDLWKFEEFCSKEINYALRSHPMDFRVWERLEKELSSDEGFIRMQREGTAIRRNENQIIETICKQASIERFSTETHHFEQVAIVNATTHWSEVGHRLLELYPEAEFSATYYVMKDGREKWSLRSRKGGVNVAEIAAGSGGGGHPNAAGFVW